MPGSQVTPKDFAIRSPIDLDIANPGRSSFNLQTLFGPFILPLKSWIAATLPPNFVILSFSLGNSGLWSVESAMCSHFEKNDCCRWARIALESPTLALYSLLSLIRTRIKVDPLISRLIEDFSRRASSSLIELKRAFSGEDSNRGFTLRISWEIESILGIDYDFYWVILALWNRRPNGQSDHARHTRKIYGKEIVST